MKRTYNKILFMILVTLILSGCRKSFIMSNEQEVLFQYEYQNNALDIQLEGFFIDKEGNVLKYKSPSEWNHPDNNLIIYRDKLSENLDRCTVYEKAIPETEVEKFSHYISNISSSKVSAPKTSGSDMGFHKFICYKYDESFKVYKGFLIKLEGDITRENLNFYSKKVVSWMKDIYRNISQ